MPNALSASGVAGVQRPPRFRALGLGPGYVVGVVRDELETERLRVLEPGPAG